MRANHRAHEAPVYVLLGNIGPRGDLNMSSPSTSEKVNRLVIRYLYFGSVRGDLQEGNGCASRCQFPLFLVPIPIFPSTKSAFLCAFWLRDPHFPAFRAQNRGFCVRMGDFSEIFGLFDTKSAFLYAFGGWNPRFRPFCHFLVWVDSDWSLSLKEVDSGFTYN